MADAVAAQLGQQVVVVTHRLTGHRHDGVAHEQTCLLSRAVRHHCADQQAGLLPQLFRQVGGQTDALRADAQIATAHPAMGQQRLDHAAHRAGRQRNTDAARQRRTVQSGDATGDIHQRTAGKAGVHDDVGLQVTIHVAARACAPGVTQRADDAQRRLHGTARPAQRQHQVANLQVGGFHPGRGGQAGCLGAQQGDVGGRITSDEIRRDAGPVGQADRDSVIVLYDVMGGNDQPVG